MSAEVVYFSFWFAVTAWLIWDVHKSNRAAHAHTQDILRDIARYLGDSDQPSGR